MQTDMFQVGYHLIEMYTEDLGKLPPKKMTTVLKMNNKISAVQAINLGGYIA